MTMRQTRLTSPYKKAIFHSPAIHCNTDPEINFTQPPARRLPADQLRNAIFADSSLHSLWYTGCNTVHCKDVHLYTIKNFRHSVICEICTRLNINYRCIARTYILFLVLFFYILRICLFYFLDGILCINCTLPYHSLLIMMFCKDLFQKSLCIHNVLPHIFV